MSMLAIACVSSVYTHVHAYAAALAMQCMHAYAAGHDSKAKG